MALPVNINYGKVIGRFLLAVGDTADAGSNPDGTPATGTATFTPSASRLLDTGSTPPTTIIPQAIVCTIDTDGDIIDPQGNKGVYLVATNDPDLSPTGWTWRVVLAFTGVASPISFSFSLPVDTTVDLTMVSPTPPR